MIILMVNLWHNQVQLKMPLLRKKGRSGQICTINQKLGFWVKEQKPPYISGPYIPPLSMIKCVIVEQSIFTVGGFDRRYNRCTDDIFEINNLDIPQILECTLVPGKRTVDLASYSDNSINGKEIQKGPAPEPSTWWIYYQYTQNEVQCKKLQK